jgi:hypothetical protein
LVKEKLIVTLIYHSPNEIIKYISSNFYESKTLSLSQRINILFYLKNCALKLSNVRINNKGKREINVRYHITKEGERKKIGD